MCRYRCICTRACMRCHVRLHLHPPDACITHTLTSPMHAHPPRHADYAQDIDEFERAAVKEAVLRGGTAGALQQQQQHPQQQQEQQQGPSRSSMAPGPSAAEEEAPTPSSAMPTPGVCGRGIVAMLCVCLHGASREWGD
jgi:hypothetical protein